MRREALYVLTIAIGLFVSARYQEWPVNLWCLGVFSYIFWKTNRKERIEMIAVLGFATPMELFFSEVWLIYEYQRGLMPLFVPVGHYFLFDLGRRVASYLPEKSPMPLILLLVPLVVFGAIKGTDTSAVLLILLTIGFVQWGMNLDSMQRWFGSPFSWNYGGLILEIGRGLRTFHGLV